MNPYRSVMFKMSENRLGSWWQLRSAPARRVADMALYRMTRGRFTLLSGILPCAMLTTTGRRTGRAITTPVVFAADGNHVVVVATKNGEPGLPHWLKNLGADPRATLSIKGRAAPYTALIVAPDEPDWLDLWHFALEHNPSYQMYVDHKGHDVPVVVFTKL